MEITNYLINKLEEMPSSFEHKGETYKLRSYGDHATSGGSVADCWVYWESTDSEKVILMDYRMKKIKDNHYSGIEKIYSIIFWEDYDAGLVYDEWEG